MAVVAGSIMQAVKWKRKCITKCWAQRSGMRPSLSFFFSRAEGFLSFQPVGLSTVEEFCLSPTPSRSLAGCLSLSFFALSLSLSAQFSPVCLAPSNPLQWPQQQLSSSAQGQAQSGLGNAGERCLLILDELCTVQPAEGRGGEGRGGTQCIWADVRMRARASWRGEQPVCGTHPLWPRRQLTTEHKGETGGRCVLSPGLSFSLFLLCSLLVRFSSQLARVWIPGILTNWAAWRRSESR